MDNSKYIDYLNTLHNFEAKNQNAFTEENQNNIYFEKTMVERGVGEYISKSLLMEEPHMLILTGHAGDGKTGLLLQVLNKWRVLNHARLKACDDILMPNGKELTYIKDFSELNIESRKEILDSCINRLQEKSVFLVANTGPLLASFKNILSENDYLDFVNSIDTNDGLIKDYSGIKVAVINIATIDNSGFVSLFVNKIINEELWSGCSNCKKKEYCPIFFNKERVRENFVHITDFIKLHYIWQQEYMKKLTIRQIVAHLSFMFTGGLSCKQVKNNKYIKFTYLFSNLFFGYLGLEKFKQASRVKAIEDISAMKYSEKKLHADEALFIKRDFSCFTAPVRNLLAELGEDTFYKESWQRSVRRAYIMQNLDTDQEHYEQMIKDVFSECYPRYLDLRGGKQPTSTDKELIKDAISMIFLGSIQKSQEILITLNRESGVVQSVQMVVGELSKNKIKLRQEEIISFQENNSYKIKLEIYGHELNTDISLPLVNYFVDIRNGAITTDLDPILSHGVDSIKAQIISIVNENEDCLKLAILKRDGWELQEAELSDGKWRII